MQEIRGLRSAGISNRHAISSLSNAPGKAAGESGLQYFVLQAS